MYAAMDAPPNAPPGSRWRALARRLRAWPLAVVVAVFLIHLPYVAPGGPWASRVEPVKLGQDEGAVLYDSWRIERGQVMYRDFFEFQGPVFYYANAALFAVTGPGIEPARLLHLIVTAIGAALLALVVARFAGRGAGLGAAAIHACVLVPIWPFAYPHWMAEMFALAALAFLTRDAPRKRDDVLAGGFLALAVLTIQSVGVPVLGAATACLALPGLARRDWRATLARPACLLGGAAVVGAPIALYFVFQHALGDLVWAMFTWPMTHYKLGQGAATSYAWGIDASLAARAKLAFFPDLVGSAALRVTWALPFFALGAAAVFAPVALFRLWKKRDDFRGVIVAGCALAGVSPVWLAPIRPDLTHVAYLGSFGVLGAAALCGPLARRFRGAAIAVTAIFAVTGATMVAAYTVDTQMTWSASRAMKDWKGEALKLSGAAWMDEHLQPTDSIAVGAMGGFYYLYVRPAAVPNTYMPATYEHYLAESQWRWIADEVVKNTPAAMSLVGIQWDQLKKRRPELAQMYKAQNGLWVLAQ